MLPYIDLDIRPSHVEGRPRHNRFVSSMPPAPPDVGDLPYAIAELLPVLDDAVT